jgi:hypothetical protein
MKEVNKDEFYNTIGPLDVCVSVENEYKYPYTSLFKLRNGTLKGKVMDNYGPEGQKYPLISKYYII